MHVQHVDTLLKLGDFPILWNLKLFFFFSYFFPVIFTLLRFHAANFFCRPRRHRTSSKRALTVSISTLLDFSIETTLGFQFPDSTRLSTLASSTLQPLGSFPALKLRFLSVSHRLPRTNFAYPTTAPTRARKVPLRIRPWRRRRLPSPRV